MTPPRRPATCSSPGSHIPLVLIGNEMDRTHLKIFNLSI
jgi:hypothetical protein